MNKFILQILTVVAFFSPLLAQAQQVKMRMAGVAYWSDEANTNQDSLDGVVSRWYGNGTFGKYEAADQFDQVAWDGRYCDADQKLSEVDVDGTTMVFTFENGTQLYAKQNPDANSQICFNGADGSSTYDIYLDVVGGTGRFAGATGSLRVHGPGQQLQVGHSAFQGTTEGDVILANHR
ncbi:MAG TPA: hypothetical protein VJ998_07205 [Pseudomonadales bacterium]|nr:hypothetical protein [Pseudomonadales bacterium]